MTADAPRYFPAPLYLRTLWRYTNAVIIIIIIIIIIAQFLSNQDQGPLKLSVVDKIYEIHRLQKYKERFLYQKQSS